MIFSLLTNAHKNVVNCLNLTLYTISFRAANEASGKPASKRLAKKQAAILSGKKRKGGSAGKKKRGKR